MRRILYLFTFIIPSAAFAQGFELSIEAGAGITQSRNRSGDALHGQVGATLFRLGEMRLRGELFHQEGTNGGAGKCERLTEGNCLGTTDRNRITALSAALHVPVGGLGRVTAYVPLGVGIYHRGTRTTETAEPATSLTLTSLTYDHSATKPGYSVGFGLMTRILLFDAFLEMRAHDILESDSMAGAVPFSVGVRF